MGLPARAWRVIGIATVCASAPSVNASISACSPSNEAIAELEQSDVVDSVQKNFVYRTMG